MSAASQGFAMLGLCLCASTVLAEDVTLRYPDRFCTVSTEGEAECVMLAALPSRALIERLLLEVGHDPQAKVQALRCDGKADAALVVDGKATAKELPDAQRTVDPVEWSLVSVERAEQNILALLRSCHARQVGEQDPVESGSAPGGAASRAALSQPSPAFAVEIAEPNIVDAEGVPFNPYAAADEAEPQTASAPAATAVAEDLAEEFAAGMYDADEPATAAPVPDDAQAGQVAPELPKGVRIVSGYDELRPKIGRIVVTWLEGAQAAHVLGVDPCSDPIGMPALGECELNL